MQNPQISRLRWFVLGGGVLLAALLACSAGQSSSGGGSAPTSPPSSGGGSGGSSASDPLEAMDPCAIVDQNDAAAFFGEASAAGMPSKGDPAFCVYATPDNVQHLSFNIRWVATGAAASDDFVAGKGANTQDVSGLGDAAYENTVMGMLSVVRGSWSFRVSGNVKDGAVPPLDKLTAVAKTALGRLP